MINKLIKKRNRGNLYQTIGGDFELTSIPSDVTDSQILQQYNKLGTWTSSGRAAFAIILQELINREVQHIYLPSYLCRSILLPIKDLGLAYSFYKVNSDLESDLEPKPGSAILLIHYFGWFNKFATRLREVAVNESVYLVEDTTHAFLSDWYKLEESSEFVFMSMRKFGPIPLGGWCSVNIPNLSVSKDVESLAWQSISARLIRAKYLSEESSLLDDDAEAFYLHILHRVEEFLDKHSTNCGLPEIAYEIIKGLNWDEISTKRRNNWQNLNNMLNGQVNTLKNELPDDVVPLGYVIYSQNRDQIKEQLAKERIFCPVHWILPGEIDAHVYPESVTLSENCLTLPIDHRYDYDDMVRIAESIQREL